MDNLYTYLAHIPNEHRDIFDAVLNNLSISSGNRPIQRINAIVPLSKKAVYEVSLSKDEALVLSLSCPGKYELYNDDNRGFMLKYLQEREL